jgi:serine/threonine-protein kinase RsbT
MSKKAWSCFGELLRGAEATALALEETLEIRTADDVVKVRQAVRSWSVKIGLGLVDQTKVVTAASELARNTLDYGGGGTVEIETVMNGVKPGIRLTFGDEGPGIADIQVALRDGYTTGNGLGLGLSGARRLSNEFEITSTPGVGTKVTITRWRG